MTFTDQDLIVLLVLAAAATLIDLALPQRPAPATRSRIHN